MTQTKSRPGERKIDGALCNLGQSSQDLTDCARAVLFYLTSISNWNSFEGEDHYFVDKRKVVKKDIASILSVSANSITSSFKMLLEKRYITEQGKYYLIWPPNIYEYMGLDLLKLLVNFYNGGAGSQLIRMCAVCARVYKDGAEKPEAFTLSDMTEMIGRSPKIASNISKTFQDLATLRGLGIIEYYVVSRTNNFGSYPTFNLTKVDLKTLPEGAVFDEKNCLDDGYKIRIQQAVNEDIEFKKDSKK